MCDVTYSFICDVTRSRARKIVWQDASTCVTRLTQTNCVCRESFICVLWLILCAQDWTHSCVPRDLLMCVRQLPHMCVVTHVYVGHDLFMSDVTHSYVWHDSFIRETWLICICAFISTYVWHVSLMSVSWLIHVYDTNHSYMWNGSSIRVTCLIYMRNMTHSYVWHDSFICVTWLIHMCDMTHRCCWKRFNSHVWHGSFIGAAESELPTIPARFLIGHSYMRHDSCVCVPWLRHGVCWMWCHHVICMRDMTHTCVLLKASYWQFMWLLHVCGMTHS